MTELDFTEDKQKSFIEFFDKFVNFYKFVKESKDLIENVWILSPDVGPVIAAAGFIPKVRYLRKQHPDIVNNIKKWTKEYYDAKNAEESGASASGLRSSDDIPDKGMLEKNIIDLAHVFKPELETEKIERLLKGNIKTAIRLVRYLDYFFDLSIIPDL